MIQKPDYYDRFSCSAGDCRHSCCIGWEIETDSETYEKYMTVSGSLGQRMREKISPDGGHCIALRDGRCEFLNEDNLCDIQLELGHELLSRVCREYPRFCESFSGLDWYGLSLSCESAAEIILLSGQHLKVNSEGDTDDGLLVFLLKVQDSFLSILSEERFPVSVRIRRLLSYAALVQEEINNNSFFVPPVDSAVQTDGYKSSSISDCLSAFGELEPIGSEWERALSRALSADMARFDEFRTWIKSREEEYAFIAEYFVYRYLMRACCDNDVLSKAKLAAVSVIAIRQLDYAAWLKRGALTDIDRLDNVRIYSQQTEHSEENMELLFDEFIFNPCFSVENLAGLI